MLGRSFGRGIALAAALAAGLGAAAGFAQPAPTVQLNASRRTKRGLFGGISMQPRRAWTYGGPGITMAQQKRASRKARHVRRNRAAHKG
jgi:hypothetical protein